jgi:spore coat protein U-like protein
MHVRGIFRSGLGALVTALLLIMTAPEARAQTCSISVTPLNFGSVDVIANAVVDATATATVTCSALVPVGVCISIGPGSGGATNAANRTLASGANTLRYGLFSDTARSVPWGSDYWPAGGAASVGFNLPIILGTGSVTTTIYGRVYGGQATTVPLSFASVFSGTEISIRYGLLSFLLGCDLLTISSAGSFTASANVPPTCRVTTSNLDFGVAGVLTGARDGSSTLTPTCTSGTDYTIGLNGGLSGASNPTLRRMSKGAESIIYGLYHDAARAQPFGNAAGVDTVASTGTGLPQARTVYGRVAAQSTPSPGTYTGNARPVRRAQAGGTGVIARLRSGAMDILVGNRPVPVG